MSASVVSEATVMNPTTSWKNDESVETQVECASCDCCGLTEECTQAYIHGIRERYQGKWICGLCGEAVNYEMRLKNKQQDEALIQHMSFCNKFKSSSPPVNLLSAMRSILRRSLDSPPTSPSCPTGRGSTRSPIHVPAMSRTRTQHECVDKD